jgi:hypothetical protein
MIREASGRPVGRPYSDIHKNFAARSARNSKKIEIRK